MATGTANQTARGFSPPHPQQSKRRRFGDCERGQPAGSSAWHGAPAHLWGHVPGQERAGACTELQVGRGRGLTSPLLPRAPGRWRCR